MTRNDIINDDADLMLTAAGLLDKGTRRHFDVALSEADGELTATFAVLGIDRADVIVDGRPRLTVDLGGNPGPVPGADSPKLVRVDGYDQGRLVATRSFVRKDTALQPRTTFDVPA